MNKLHRPGQLLRQYFTAHETTRLLELEGTRLASFRARAFAFAFDGFLVMLIIALIAGLIFLSSLKPQDYPLHKLAVNIHLTNGYKFDINGKKIGWMSYVIEFALPVLYWGLLTYFMNGRTPGKWLAGIRVVSTSHQKIRFWQSVERALGYSVSALELGFGFLQYFISPNRRATHDRLAETIVICDPDRGISKKWRRIASRGEGMMNASAEFGKKIELTLSPKKQ